MRRIIQNYRAWGGDIPAIQSPAFVVNGDAEEVRAEHAMALARALPHAQLAILPGEHGDTPERSSQQTRPAKYLPCRRP